MGSFPQRVNDIANGKRIWLTRLKCYRSDLCDHTPKGTEFFRESFYSYATYACACNGGVPLGFIYEIIDL